MTDPNGKYMLFRCPACNRNHMVQISGEGAWAWNGSITKPTFSPSVLVKYDGKDAGLDGAPPARCHSMITDGRITFYTDSTHSMAGATAQIPVWGNS